MISELDVKYRAHLLMLSCTTGSEFRAFIKRHRKQFFVTMFADNVVLYHLLKLRIRAWILSFLYVLFPTMNPKC